MKSENKKKKRERKRETRVRRYMRACRHESTCIYGSEKMVVFVRVGKKHFPVRVGDALEAETIFDSTHAKIHIAALKGGREKPREGEREREMENEGEREARAEWRIDVFANVRRVAATP